MTPRRLLTLALLAVLGGCGGGEPSPSAASTSPSAPSSPPGPSASDPSGDPAPRPVPTTLTPQDDGSTFTMPVGTSAGLVVPDPNASDPVLTGDSVQLVPLVNVTDSGEREWEVRAVAPGSTTIRLDAPELVITVVVR